MLVIQTESKTNISAFKVCVHWFVLREQPFEFVDQSGTISWLFLLALSFDRILWRFVLVIINHKEKRE
jgi:hypothetical protein